MGLLNKLLKKRQAKEKDSTGERSDQVRITPNEVPGVGGEVKPSKRQDKKQDDQLVVKKSGRLPENSLAYEILVCPLVCPLVTEKSAVAESLNKYSFVVARWTTKQQIIRVIKEIYGIKPTKVQIVNMTGHGVRFKGRNGWRQDYKKAIISLPKGKSIDIHKGV